MIHISNHYFKVNDLHHILNTISSSRGPTGQCPYRGPRAVTSGRQEEGETARRPPAACGHGKEFPQPEVTNTSNSIFSHFHTEFSSCDFIVLHSPDINYLLQMLQLFHPSLAWHLFLILDVRFASLFCRGKILFSCIVFIKIYTCYIIYIHMYIYIYTCLYKHIIYIISCILVLFMSKHFALFS